MRQRRGLIPRATLVLSLLVCAATALLWYRSYRVTDDLFVIYQGDGSEELSCLRGEFRFKHTLPQSGKRQGLARVTHRQTRVVSLPLRPWAEDRLRRTAWIFRYDDSIYNVKRVVQARAAVQAYWNYQIQGPAPADGLSPREARAIQTKSRQIQAAYMAAQPILTNTGYQSYWAVTFPVWLLMVPAILLMPVAWLATALRAAVRARAGRCRSCGYDLTGNLSGVCPECGAALTSNSASVPIA